jgi:hypothetical protein
VRLIEEACHARDRAALAELAVSEHGLVLDRLRKTACELHQGISSKNPADSSVAGPLLLGCDDSRNSGGRDARLAWQALPKHGDEDQVKLDVDRSFIYYPNGLRLLPARKPCKALMLNS